MSELLDEIRKRIDDPITYAGEKQVERHETEAEWAARAVATLFETADPEEASKLRTIDLPAELVAAAAKLREAAEEALCNERSTPEEMQPTADRLGFLANVVEDVSHLIVNPARTLQTLMRDRDQWQRLERQAEEGLALTEAALAVSQKSNVALAEGQSTLIELLERVARAGDDEHTRLVIARLYTEWMTTAASGDEMMVKLLRECLGDVLPEIHATLNQVTAIETDASGRLTVAQQPEQEPEPMPSPGATLGDGGLGGPPLVPGICSICGRKTDTKRTICDDCLPF